MVVANYEWSCLVCEKANPPGSRVCIVCGGPAGISSQEIEGRRRARTLGEAYVPSKHDFAPVPQPTNSFWEAVSLGSNTMARRVGAGVWGGSVIFALIWLGFSLAVEMSWWNRMANVAVLLFSASLVRGFSAGKSIYVDWLRVPAEPGRTGLRWFAGLLSFLVVGWMVLYMLRALI